MKRPTRGGDSPTGFAPRRTAIAAAVFLGLAVVHTWPLATAPDRLSRFNDDEWLNAWAVSWVAHQLTTDPLELYDANMFHPTERAFGYTEPLIVPAVIGMPFRWLGASSLLTYNLLLLLGLMLTALATYVLVVTWTGDHWAGLLAGALLAFSTQMLTRLPQLQALHLYSLPLALLCLERLTTRGRWRDAMGVGVWVTCAALTSGYLVLIVVFGLGAALVARWRRWWHPDGRWALLKLGTVAAATLAVLLIVLGPYWQLSLRRPLMPEAPSIGVMLQSYLSSAANLHYATWSQPFFDRAPGVLFPGAIGLVLTCTALLAAHRTAPKGTRTLLVVMALVGGVLSLGALTPIYRWAASLLPPLLSLRVTQRFGILVFFAVASLAGFGLSMLRRRIPEAWRPAGSIAVLVVVTIEGLHAPIPYEPLDPPPAVYGAIARSEIPGAAVSLPIFSGNLFHQNAWYLLMSTTHWRPVVNGYGGFRPPGYDDTARVIATFPALPAVARLQSLGVTHVVVHTSRYREPRLIREALRLRSRPDLALVERDGADRLYHVSPVPRTPVGEVLYSLPWEDLIYADGSRPESYLRAAHNLGVTFGLQGATQFVLYLENTRNSSRVSLRPPVRMTGEFIDATDGSTLGEITVEPPQASAPPATIAPPAGYGSVLLQLRPTG